MEEEVLLPGQAQEVLVPVEEQEQQEQEQQQAQEKQKQVQEVLLPALEFDLDSDLYL